MFTFDRENSANMEIRLPDYSDDDDPHDSYDEDDHDIHGTPVVAMEGSLKRRNPRSGIWKERHFSLCGRFLHAYSSTVQDELIDSIDVSHLTPVHDTQTFPTRAHVFSLGSIVFLQASCDDMARRWIKAIRGQIMRLALSATTSNFRTPSDQLKSFNLHQRTPLVSGSLSSNSELILPKHCKYISLMFLYETFCKFYLVGKVSKDEYRLLTIGRDVPHKLDVIVDPGRYTRTEVETVLEMVRSANATNGGLTFKISCTGIVGFVRFLTGYYIILVTEQRLVGIIGSHRIYTLSDYTMIPVCSDLTLSKYSLNTKDKLKLEKKYMDRFLMVDMRKNFFFSKTYDLSRSLQSNMSNTMLRNETDATMWDWNHALLNELKQAIQMSSSQTITADGSLWVTPIIHGYFEHRRCSIFGRVVSIYLISRRSRLYAGTRYLKRGLNDHGHCANEVETEQILHCRSGGHRREGHYTSIVQLRASIPLFWTQESKAIVPRPPVIIQKVDPMGRGTRLHFESLFRRYGAPILILNLIRQKEKTPRETRVGLPFRHAVEFMNSFLPVQSKLDYVGFDFKKYFKSKAHSAVDELMVIAEWAVHRNAFFHNAPNAKAFKACSSNTIAARPTREDMSAYVASGNLHIGHTQVGVCRSNCIDSLDRTNIAQFCIGKCAMAYQLYSMDILPSPKLDSDSPIVKIFLDMYERNGDALAMQYGGSQMHRQMRRDDKMKSMAPVLYREQAKSTLKPKEIVVSLMRHYQNSFQDRDKQDAINIFLGIFLPSKQSSYPPLWDMLSDHYLHNPAPSCLDFSLDFHPISLNMTITPDDSANTRDLDNHPPPDALISFDELFNDLGFSSDTLISLGSVSRDYVSNRQVTDENFDLDDTSECLDLNLESQSVYPIPQRVDFLLEGSRKLISTDNDMPTRLGSQSVVLHLGLPNGTTPAFEPSYFSLALPILSESKLLSQPRFATSEDYRQYVSTFNIESRPSMDMPNVGPYGIPLPQTSEQDHLEFCDYVSFTC